MLSVRNVFIFFKFLVFIAALLPFYFLLKVIFFFWNSSLFSLLNVKRDLWDILIFSFQTDIASIILINFIVIFLMMGAILQPGRKRVIFLKIAYWWAIVINSLGFALNILDIGYFKFNKERSTTGLLSVFTGSLSSARSIISIYWPLFILFLIVVILLALLLKSFFKTFLITNQLNIKQEFVSGLLTVSFLFIMVRGWHNGLLIPATPL